MRACGGLYRHGHAGHFADVHSLQVTCASRWREPGRPGALIGDKGHKASDSIGTLHVSHWVPFEHNRAGFFTVFDGDMGEVLPGLCRQDRLRLQCSSFPRVVGGPPTRGQKNAQAFLPVGAGKQLSVYWVLERLSRPLGSGHQGPLVDSESPSATADERLGFPWSRTRSSIGGLGRWSGSATHEWDTVVRGWGTFRRLLGRRRHEPSGAESRCPLPARACARPR